MAGIEYYTGLGGTTFVGAGAAVLGRSPMVEAIGIVNKHKDWWIQVRTALQTDSYAAARCHHMPCLG